MTDQLRLLKVHSARVSVPTTALDRVVIVINEGDADQVALTMHRAQFAQLAARWVEDAVLVNAADLVPTEGMTRQ